MTTSERKGRWFATFTGRQFYPFDPRAEDVCIEDIAHALSNICRFGGHVRELYTVSQHSVLVSNWLRDHGHAQDAFWGLMHDAAEAFCGDMIWPLKKSPELSAFPVVEHGVMVAVAERFGLTMPEPPAVKHADLVALATEKRDLMAPSRRDTTNAVAPEVTMARHAGLLPWDTDVEPMEDRIVPWSPVIAEFTFLNRFHELGGRR